MLAVRRTDVWTDRQTKTVPIFKVLAFLYIALETRILNLIKIHHFSRGSLDGFDTQLALIILMYQIMIEIKIWHHH